MELIIVVSLAPIVKIFGMKGLSNAAVVYGTLQEKRGILVSPLYANTFSKISLYALNNFLIVFLLDFLLIMEFFMFSSNFLGFSYL